MQIDQITLRMIFSAIRKSFKMSEIYENQLKKYLSKKKGPRGGNRFDCDICKKPFLPKEIEMDHYPEPVVPLNKRWHQISIEEYYNRVFCFPIRALCKSCHKTITKKQKAKRTK